MASAHCTIAAKDFDAVSGIRISHAPVQLTDVPATIRKKLGLAHKESVLDVFSMGERDARMRVFRYFKNAREVNDRGKILWMDKLLINGDVRDPSAWSSVEDVVDEEALREVTRFIDFGTYEAAPYLNFAWSGVEVGPVTTSWSLDRAAAVSARLPNQNAAFLSARIRSPIKGQEVEVTFNGRSVAKWAIDRRFREYTAKLKLLPRERGQIGRIGFLVAKHERLSERDPRLLGVRVDWVKLTDNRGNQRP